MGKRNPLPKSLTRIGPFILLLTTYHCGLFDIEPPEITIIKPKPGVDYINVLPIDVEVYDNKSVDRVEVTLNGDRLPTSGEEHITGEIDVTDYGTGSFTFKVQAWDKADNFNEASLEVTLKVETVTAPTISGPTDGKTNTSYDFTLSGASSSLNHNLEYYIEWGDGSSRDWNTNTSASHSWNQAGTYSIRTKARCASHSSAESDWSSPHIITLSDVTITGNITPTSIDFGTVTIGQSTQQSATIANASTSEANLTGSVSITGSDYSLATGSSGSFNLSPGGSKVITINFNPSLPEGNKTGAVTISHGATNLSSPTTISLTGYAQEKPDTIDMTISDPSIAFGGVLIGQSSDIIITISNAATSTANLNISASVSGTGFTCYTGCGSVSIHPGQSHSITIRFSPTASGNYSGSLTIGHNATNQSTPVTISLGGTGTQETVSTPNAPSGTQNGLINTTYNYSTGGATSSEGHSVQYRFDWGDGNYSDWSSSTSASKSWSNEGTYSVKAQARCATHNDVVSEWSTALSVTIAGEQVSAPNTPSGPSSLCPGSSGTYSTGGASSNLGHSIQYRFDWGDGTYSSWSSSTNVSHSWSSTGTKHVKAQARCATHTSVVSSWSGSKTVTIASETISTPNTPSGPSTGYTNTSYTYSTGGASSSCGHSLQYRFNWGDGTASSWSSSTSASHSWSSTGTKYVSAQARCATHTTITSNWSDLKSVSIIPEEQTWSVDTNEDAFVYAGTPSTNYGTDASLVVARDASGYYRAFIDFNVSSNIPSNATIVEATLTLYKFTHQGSPFTFYIAYVTGTWSETGVTWNNMPSSLYYSSRPHSFPTGNGFIDYDVTLEVRQMVNGGYSEGFMLFGSSISTGNSVFFWSREAGSTNAPHLEVIYTVP